MSQIQINHLSFYYEGSYDYIFDDVSFKFDTLYKTALIGRNARGKTTLLNLMLGKYQYQGDIIMSEQCEYFPYHVENIHQWTLDVCFEVFPLIEQWQLERELRYLKLDPDELLYRMFDTLSYGEQMKVLLAVLFLKQNVFLLIDEPTNHLDSRSREIVAQYLKRQKGFLLVSHDRYFIDLCCDHVIAINPQTIEVVQGNFSSWYYNKQKRDEREISQNDKLKKDIEQLEVSRRRTACWSYQVEKSKRGAADKGYVGHKAAKMMKRSQSIDARKNKAIEEKKSLLKDIEEYEDLKIFPMMYHQDLLYFSHVSINYGKRTLFRDLTFEIKNHDRVLLRGHNGCGKSSVIRLIMGEDICFHGEYYCGQHLIISYVPQDSSHLKGYLDEYIDDDIDSTLVRTILRKLGFKREALEKRMETLSEGQKKKVLMAISLATPAHLYIWDEPLNYIDVFSRIQIEKLILEYQPTLLFVEHDAIFQQHIATKVIDFH